MKNTTKIKIPKKYHHMLELVEKDSDGYWAYSNDGFYFAHMDCHTAHEDTQKDLLMVIRTLEVCECEECKPKGETGPVFKNDVKGVKWNE